MIKKLNFVPTADRFDSQAFDRFSFGLRAARSLYVATARIADTAATEQYNEQLTKQDN